MSGRTGVDTHTHTHISTQMRIAEKPRFRRGGLPETDRASAAGMFLKSRAPHTAKGSWPSTEPRNQARCVPEYASKGRRGGGCDRKACSRSCCTEVVLNSSHHPHRPPWPILFVSSHQCAAGGRRNHAQELHRHHAAALPRSRL